MLYSKAVSDIKQNAKINCYILNLVVKFKYITLIYGDEND